MDEYNLESKSQDQINTMIETVLNESSMMTGVGNWKPMTHDKFYLLRSIVYFEKHRKYSLQIIKHLQDYMKWSPSFHHKLEIEDFKALSKNIIYLIKQMEN